MSLTSAQLDDVSFLSETTRWSYWPFCPVKRYDREKKESVVATCFDDEGGKRVVILANMFNLMHGVTTESEAERIEYANSYEMICDGWIVD